MTEQEKIDKIKLESSDKAFHVFGFGYIFSKRINKYIKLINVINFSGIVLPLTVGALAVSYKHDILAIAITIITPLTIFQLIFSTLSIVYKWSDELAYAFEASQDYSIMYDEFNRLYKFPSNVAEMEKKFEVLNTKFNSREQQNSKYKISEKELRAGMRYSLREHKKECAGCNIIPTSMQPSKCGVCGNF